MRRAAALRRAARGEEGPQGHGRPAGHVRGPRPEVRRPGRRARRRGAGERAAAGPGLRRPGDRARAHPQGHGYPPAETDEADRCTRRGDRPRDRAPRSAAARDVDRRSSPTRWSRSARERPDVVAITAAMLHPTGLRAFAAAFPERVFDVGIAEQHAVTSAAGLAMGGLHPVVAVYATFLNRAFDQLLMDVALHRPAVTVVLDRAGVTGEDGAEPPRHVGPVARCGGARAAARGAARRATLREELPRRSRSPTGRPWCASQRAVPPDDPGAASGVGGMDVLRRGERSGRAARAVGVDGARPASTSPSGWRPGDRGDGRRPALGAAGAGELVELARPAPAGGDGRGRRPGRRRRRRGGADPARRGGTTCRCAPSGCRSSSSSTAAAGRCSPAAGLTSAEVTGRLVRLLARQDGAGLARGAS